MSDDLVSSRRLTDDAGRRVRRQRLLARSRDENAATISERTRTGAAP
jgi:hypothetical protein